MRPCALDELEILRRAPVDANCDGRRPPLELGQRALDELARSVLALGSDGVLEVEDHLVRLDAWRPLRASPRRHRGRSGTNGGDGWPSARKLTLRYGQSEAASHRGSPTHEARIPFRPARLGRRRRSRPATRARSEPRGLDRRVVCLPVPRYLGDQAPRRGPGTARVRLPDGCRARGRDRLRRRPLLGPGRAEADDPRGLGPAGGRPAAPARRGQPRLLGPRAARADARVRIARWCRRPGDGRGPRRTRAARGRVRIGARGGEPRRHHRPADRRAAARRRPLVASVRRHARALGDRLRDRVPVHPAQRCVCACRAAAARVVWRDHARLAVPALHALVGVRDDDLHRDATRCCRSPRRRHTISPLRPGVS